MALYLHLPVHNGQSQTEFVNFPLLMTYFGVKFLMVTSDCVLIVWYCILNQRSFVSKPNIFFKFIYFERHREGACTHVQASTSVGGAERERESQVGSALRGHGLHATNREIMISAEIGNRMLNQQNHPGAPNLTYFLFMMLNPRSPGPILPVIQAEQSDNKTLNLSLVTGTVCWPVIWGVC